ncbi:MAG TPA: hypothetical protein VN812_02485 [Candidatus Acidoferrales bacterium]|nr:hypothetical protein [Candidatus Acidoferrales bacterium]
MTAAPSVEFNALLTAEQLAQLIGIVETRMPYPTYGEGRRQEGFGAGIPQRYDAARNFVNTRAGQDEVWKLASRTNYFRETFAYEEPLFPEIAFFQQLPQFIAAARQVTGRPIVRPAIVYLNILVPGQELALHTDVPEFRGANRTREPEWLLVAMHHSGLFNRWRRHIATGVSWYHDCNGGEFVYYANGPEQPPRRLAVRRNTAIVLDTDSVFHGIDPLAARGTALPPIEPGVRLHRDDDGRWSIRHGSQVRAAYNWDDLRLSVSWKAWCFADEAELHLNDDHSDDLTLEQILDTFVGDLRQRGKIGSRPDDETLARLILDEYIRFPRESVQ